MILLISSKLSGPDHVIKNLSEKLSDQKVPHFALNPHNIITSNCVLSQKGNNIQISFGSRQFVPSVVYMANNWRCDSIIRIPQSIDYPAAFRMRIYQFMQDIRFSFEEAKWIPGKIESIERSDSKPALMRNALLCGLSIPDMTINSFSGSTICNENKIYRKNLGYPFVVTLNKKTGVEVGVTTTNTLYVSEIHKDDDQPWQWQSAIEASCQIRCYVINNKIWSVCSAKSQSTDDLRQISQVDKVKVQWEPYILPDVVQHNIFKLMQVMGINVAAPEFLVTKDGQHVFIDLNPCGDWYGFFSGSTKEEILNHLILTLMESSK